MWMQEDFPDRLLRTTQQSLIHWNICRRYQIPVTQNWWEHKAEKIVENEQVKILWDFRIQSDKHLAYNTPDLTIVEKKQVWIVDVAIPGDTRIEEKESQSIRTY